MNLNISNLHTIYEQEESKVKSDEYVCNMDNTLSDNDLLGMYDKAEPISSEVFSKMREAAADPQNLKLTILNKPNADPKVYIEAVEFMTFCEANDYTVGEAAEAIIEAYEEVCPAMQSDEIHVVFPSDAVDKNTIGVPDSGYAVKDDWSSKLMRGCRRYGLRVAVHDGAMNESFRHFGNPERHIESNEREDVKSDKKDDKKSDKTEDGVYSKDVLDKYYALFEK